MADQLRMWDACSDVHAWAHEGTPCPRCVRKGADGVLTLVVASAPCTCADAVCTCLAEGYAKCHSCGFLRQVWPREVVVHWAAAEVAKTA